MDITIVSGTYNRLPSLQRMITSARNSIRHSVTMNFMLVDGGSNDGTIEWIKTQEDCAIIEHGELRGAVQAFNDGAFAAKADYVIMANDDIEFVGDSVYRAYLFMQQNINCGVGCFYQNRNGRNWHVERMPVVFNGQQDYSFYGQVCIVPKWLGDYVGWWGDYLRTYGGDNELSSRVYELGFQVLPIGPEDNPYAMIADHQIKDDLRKLNNVTGSDDPSSVGGHHPDSWAWGKRWRNERANLVGPVLKDRIMIRNQTEEKQRILYLPIYEPGWPIQKEQKRGLRQALSKIGLTVEFDYVSKFHELGKAKMMEEIKALMEELRPTLFLSQLHNDANIGPGDIANLRNGSTKFVNWNGDFWPENLLSEEGLELAMAFDLQLTINRQALDTYRNRGINADYWQVAFEPDGVGHDPVRFCDVVFLANAYSPARKKFVAELRQMPIVLHLYGNGWSDAVGQSTYNFIEGCQAYRGAKIALGDSQWPDTGFVSNRIFQALAAGNCAVAHQWFKDMDRLGLIDGETCIIWHNTKELKDKIDYYLNHESERQRIADNGERLALTRHSFDNRVSQLLEMVQPVEDWR